MSFHEYSSDYLPACPVCEISLGSIGQQPTLGPLEAIVDTGSDMAIIPTRYLDQIGAKRLSQRIARRVWGDFRQVELYVVSFALAGLRFKALRVLADDVSNEIIVGGFVLNLASKLTGFASIKPLQNSIYRCWGGFAFFVRSAQITPSLHEYNLVMIHSPQTSPSAPDNALLTESPLHYKIFLCWNHR